MFARTNWAVVPASTTARRAVVPVAVLLAALVVVPAASAQETYVSPTGSDAFLCFTPLTPCRTIGGGIALAANGWTVHVAAGTYAESVVVNKEVTLQGAGNGVSTGSRAAGSAAESIVDARGLGVGFDVQADNVTIDGFDVLGDSDTWAGIKMFGTRDNVTIRHNFIHGMADENPNSNSFSYAYGIWALGDGNSTARGTITGLVIDQNDIYNLGGANLPSGHVSGGVGAFLFSLSGGDTGTGALVTDNHFRDMASGSHTLWPQPGLGVALMQDDDANRLDSGARLSSNNYTDVVIGVVMHTRNSLIQESNGDFSDVDIFVTQLDGNGSVLEFILTPFNTRDDEHLLVFPVFGITSKVYFPVNRTLYVDDSGSDALNICTDPLNPCRTIQWAGDRAFDGDTIQVGAGTYAETVTIGKELTLNGAGAGVATTARTAGSVSESILNASGFGAGFDIQSDNVTINGFDILGNASTWAGVKMFGARDNVTIQNNFIHGVAGSNPNSASFSYSYGVWGLGGGSAGNRGDITDLDILNNHIFDLGGSGVFNGFSGGAGVFLFSTSGVTAGDGVTIQGNRFSDLPDGTHSTFGLQPGVGVSVLQDDEPGTVDGGALISGNTYSNTSIGVTTEVDNSSVDETNASFSGVTVLVLNAESLAAVNEMVLAPYVRVTDPSLGVFSAPAGSVAYFSNLQDAVDNSGTPTVTVEGNVTGGAGPATTRILLDGAELVIIQNGLEIFRGTPGSIGSIVVNGTDGDDSLEIDLDLLGFLGATGVLFNGGLGSDSMSFVGGSGLTTVEHTFLSPNDGFVEVDGSLIATYTGLDPIVDALVAANRIFTFTAGPETVVFSDDGAPGNGFSFIDGTLAESVTFAHPTTTLTVNLGAGNDTITMTELDATLTVDPIVNGGGGSDRFNVTPSANYAISINGNSPTVAPGDVLDIDLIGTAGATLSNAGGGGSWTFTNRQAIAFTGIETQIDDPSQADLALTKSAGTTIAFPDDILVFTLTLSNTGPGTASGIEVTDVLPGAFTCLCSETLSEGAFAEAGGTITWSGIGLAPGESATLQYSAQAPGGVLSGTATNSAAITALSPVDPDPTNNSASVTVTFERPIRFPAGAVVQALTFVENPLGGFETLAGTFNFGLYRNLPAFIGNRWAPITSTLSPALVVNDLMVTAAGTIYLASHGYDALYTSTDRGRSWTPVDFGGPNLTIIHAMDESPVDGVIYISADDGQVWRQVAGFWDFASRLPGGSAHTPWALAADPAVSGRVFAGTFGDGVYRSDNHGETWVKVSGGALPDNGSIHVFDLEFDPELTPTTLWAATSAGIYFSQDGGVTWIDASSGLGNFREVRSIAFGPPDPAPAATGPMYVATWGGGVFELPSDRATFPSWTNVTLRHQQVGIVGVSPDGLNLFAGPATGGTVSMPIAASVTSDEDPVEVPTSVMLSQNYPNPFNPRTTITFAVPEAGRVSLTVHDIVGRSVATLVDGMVQAGDHEVSFDARDLPSGPYIYRLTTGTTSVDRIMMLMK